jgi:hypothetical protein
MGILYHTVKKVEEKKNRVFGNRRDNYRLTVNPKEPKKYRLACKTRTQACMSGDCYKFSGARKRHLHPQSG